MAIKLIFITDEQHFVREEEFNYEFFKGFAISQKQKSIVSLHKEIEKRYPNKKVLEISSKSNEKIGKALSAFSLLFFDKDRNMSFTVENIFQSSKIFESGGPYRDLLFLTPIEAKKDERIRNSGQIIGFKYNNQWFDNEPKTLFYDWIYLNALSQNAELSKAICDYDIFTDIEFNQKKSVNCQARSCAIFVSISRNGMLKTCLNNIDEFKKIYSKMKDIKIQMHLF